MAQKLASDLLRSLQAKCSAQKPGLTHGLHALPSKQSACVKVSPLNRHALRCKDARPTPAAAGEAGSLATAHPADLTAGNATPHWDKPALQPSERIAAEHPAARAPGHTARRRCGASAGTRTGDVAARDAASGAPAVCLDGHCKCARRCRRLACAPPELVGSLALVTPSSACPLCSPAVPTGAPPAVCRRGGGCEGSPNTGRCGCWCAGSRTAVCASVCHQPWLRPGGGGGAAGVRTGIQA